MIIESYPLPSRSKVGHSDTGGGSHISPLGCEQLRPNGNVWMGITAKQYLWPKKINIQIDKKKKSWRNNSVFDLDVMRQSRQYSHIYQDCNPLPISPNITKSHPISLRVTQYHQESPTIINSQSCLVVRAFSYVQSHVPSNITGNALPIRTKPPGGVSSSIFSGEYEYVRHV